MQSAFGLPPKFPMPRVVTALMLREMATTYGRSPGGYVWAVLEPVGAIALLSIVFSLAFHAPSLGKSFPLFYATGFLPFLLFNDVVAKLMSALQFSRPLLSYPIVTFMDALLARLILNFGTHILVCILVVGGILFIFDTASILRPGPIALAFVMVAALAFGFGVLNCLLVSAAPVWLKVWQIGTRPLFVISGIFFVLEDVPQPFRDLLWYNPLIHITAEMRRGIYVTYNPSWVSPQYVLAMSGIACVVGTLFLRRFYKDLMAR